MADDSTDWIRGGHLTYDDSIRFAWKHCLMEMLRKLSVGGAFKVTRRLRNMGGQFGVVGTSANSRRMELVCRENQRKVLQCF